MLIKGLKRREKQFNTPQFSITFKKPSHTAYTEIKVIERVTAPFAPFKRAGKNFSGALNNRTSDDDKNTIKKAIFKKITPLLQFYAENLAYMPKKILL